MSEYREAPNFDEYSKGSSITQNEPSVEISTKNLTKPVAKRQQKEVFIDKPTKKSLDHLNGTSSEFISFLHELPNDVVHLGLYLKKLDQSHAIEGEKKVKMMYELGNIIGIPNFTHKDEVAMHAILDYKNSFDL